MVEISWEQLPVFWVSSYGSRYYFSLVVSLPLFSLRSLSNLVFCIFRFVAYNKSKIREIQESSPTNVRGILSTLSEVSFAVMCVVTSLLGTPEFLGSHLSYLLGIAIPPCLFFSDFNNTTLQAWHFSFLLSSYPKHRSISSWSKRIAKLLKSL